MCSLRTDFCSKLVNWNFFFVSLSVVQQVKVLYSIYAIIDLVKAATRVALLAFCWLEKKNYGLKVSEDLNWKYLFLETICEVQKVA